MKRIIKDRITSKLREHRAVALLGARQVGKSWILKQIIKAEGGTLITLDDPLEREEIRRDPVSYLKARYQPGKYLFIDEAAKVPEIFSAVKILIDENDPRPTGICLANSGNYILLRRIKESLAGRVHLLPIYSLSWQEFMGSGKKPGLLELIDAKIPSSINPPTSSVETGRSREERMIWGGYPEPTLRKDTEFRIAWSLDYIRTYILPLVVEQFGIRETSAFERAAFLLFAQSAGYLNISKLARLTGVSQQTVDGFARQLEAMMVVELSPAYLVNPLKRIVKQPKTHVLDQILMQQASGTNFSFQTAVDRNIIGGIYESFIFSEIRKTMASHDIPADCFAWRTQDGAEVDIVLSVRGQITPFEVKWTTKPSGRDASGLKSFLNAHPEIKRGFIIYPGEELRTIAKNILAIPDWWLLGC